MSQAIVFSEYNILSSHLVEFLLTSRCRVDIVCQGQKAWKQMLPHLEENRHLHFLASSENIHSQASYVFVIAGVGPNPYGNSVNEGLEKLVGESFEYLQKNPTKAVFLLPFLQESYYQKQSLLLVNRLKVKHLISATTIYLPELYGARMNFEEKYPLTRLIQEAVFSSMVALPENNFDLHYAYVKDVVREIVQKTFSFGFDSDNFVLTETASFLTFVESLKELKPSLSTYQDSGLKSTKLVSGLEAIRPSDPDPHSLSQTLKWLASYAPVPVTQEKPVVKTEKVKPAVLVKPPRKLLSSRSMGIGVVIMTLWLICLPFLSLLLSLGFLRLAYSSLIRGDFKTTAKILTISRQAASVSRGSFAVASTVPVLGKHVVFAKDTASVLMLSAQAGVRGIKVVQEMTQLVEGVLSDTDYDLVGLSGQMNQDYDMLHKEAVFLETEFSRLPAFIQTLVPKQIDLSRLVDHLAVMRDLSDRLPILLGSDQQTNYLVLLQNNMELRPTGGFIGSFALLTFEKGKLINMEVNDVYSADGQLKGHVEPPAVIKEYLGEANWYLRDSNWDPDFPQSATRAEWFLNKEMDRAVDGVVAIDLELAKAVLASTGSITLADYEQEIDHKNLYEKVQYEVEADFFPGSRKKANFLTALSRALLERLTQVPQEKYLPLAKALYQSLEGRHIQIFFHDVVSAKAISQAGWDGGVDSLACSRNCQSLLVGTVEANLGVNKANYFVKREIAYNGHIEGNWWIGQTVVNLTNNANPALGLAGKYKVYLRALAPLNSHFESVEIIDTQGTKYEDVEIAQTAGRVEGGVLVEVSPQTKKRIVFSYKVPLTITFSQGGEIWFLFRKQAGIMEHPVSLQLAFPRQVMIWGLDSLTPATHVDYNTNLFRDLITRFYW